MAKKGGGSRPIRLEKYARHLRGSGELIRAAGFYSAAAFGWFSRIRHLPEEISEEADEASRLPKFVAWGVTDVQAAALCYRIDEQSERARSHCKQGILFVSDVVANEERFTGACARQGLAKELIGDFRVLGGLENAESAYAEAEKKYQEVDSPVGWQAEEEFSSTIISIMELTEAIESDLDRYDRLAIERESLIDRVRYKRERFPDVVAKTVE